MKHVKSFLVMLVLVLLAAVPLQAQGNKEERSGSTETYFGQKPPGTKAEVFAPDMLTIEPHDSPVIMQDESLMIIGSMEEGILFYEMTNGTLSLTPNPLGFDIPTICQGVAVSPSKNRFYIRDWNDGDAYFYFIDKTANGWTSPKSLGDDVNSIDTHWQFTVAANENLYFLSRGQGIVVSVSDGDAHLKPVPLKLEDGSDLQGGTPYISPDESYLLFCANDDLMIGYRLSNGKWTTPRNLGPDINSTQLDICPRVSPNGKYLFFISRRSGADFITCWADASFIEDLRPKELE